jgi:hypothetical protein
LLHFHRYLLQLIWLFKNPTGLFLKTVIGQYHEKLHGG